MSRRRAAAVLVAALLLAGCTAGDSAAPTALPPTAAVSTAAPPTAPPPTAAPTLPSPPTEAPRPIVASPAPTRPACALGGQLQPLAAQLGAEMVGECVEEPRTNPTNGDLEQRTTRGLLIWRKADDLATFVNGASAYYGCADGVQKRAAAEPFACGLALASPVPQPAPGFAPVASPTAVPLASACPNAIPWIQAKGQVGRQATIGGPVARANYASTSRGQPTFVDLGVGFPDPNRFTILIWGANRRAFPSPPEQLYAGKTVCVTGPVTLFQGIPQIEVTSPAAIRVVQ